MDQRIKTLMQLCEDVFQKRSALVAFWQDIAENFYVERANFTVGSNAGMDFAAGLETSYPLLARRDLGNAFSAMLRPSDREWFHIRAKQESREDTNARRWLEWATCVQRRAMYDRRAQLTRACKEGDHDFAAFGQAVISAEIGRDGASLLHRCWHLRDVAWCENAEGQVDTIFRKWNPTAHDLVRTFGAKSSAKVRDGLQDDPFDTVECRHIVVPSDLYEVLPGEKKRGAPYVSIYYDVDNDHVMEERGVWNTIYIVPRWQTVSGSQYAYSPATVVALPDARLIQAMTAVLIEAGERAANPPMIAVQDMVKSSIDLFPGGVTWVDADYDERLGEVLRPLVQDKTGLPLGIELRNDVRAVITEAFYLNKIGLPPISREMTAFEVGQRVTEYIRQALPLFEPMEQEYNGQLCEIDFGNLMRGGAFGAVADIPPSLRGADIEFRFESPLHEAVERQKAIRLGEARQAIAQVADLEPTAAQMLDVRVALRDALQGLGVPAKWTRDEREMAARDQARAQAQAAEALLGGVARSAGITKTVGEAGQSLGAALTGA